MKTLTGSLLAAALIALAQPALSNPNVEEVVVTAKQPAAQMLSDMTDEIVAETSTSRFNRRPPPRSNVSTTPLAARIVAPRARGTPLARTPRAQYPQSPAARASAPPNPQRRGRSPRRAPPCSAAARSPRA